MRGRMAGMVALAWAKRQIKGMDLNPTTVAAGVVALGVASAAASWAEARRTAGVLKMTAATGYLGLALMGGALGTGYGRAILAALILCWIGDLLLIAPGRGAAFLGGLGSFLVGHLAFAWAFHVHGVDYGWLTAGGVAASTVGLSVSRWLAAHDVPEHEDARGPLHRRHYGDGRHGGGQLRRGRRLGHPRGCRDLHGLGPLRGA